MRTTLYQRRQLTGIRGTFRTTPYLVVDGNPICLHKYLQPGRFNHRGRDVYLLMPFTAAGAADVLQDARWRGINNVGHCYTFIKRGTPGSNRLILEFSGQRGFRILSCVADYLRLLRQIMNPRASELIRRELIPDDRRALIRYRQSSREERFHKYYMQLSPAHTLPKYTFWKRISVSETLLRRLDVLAEDERMPTKKTVFAWVDRWHRKFSDRESVIDNHTDLRKSPRSRSYSGQGSQPAN